MRPIIVATYSKDKRSCCPLPPPPGMPPNERNRRFVTVCSKSSNSEVKTADEQTGREQIAEQTVLLRNISDQLKEIAAQTERNAATNSALLVLLTHVLKGGDNPAENGQLFNGDKGVDCDSKSFGSDADLVEKSDDRRSL